MKPKPLDKCHECQREIDPDDEDDHFQCDECGDAWCGSCFDKFLTIDDTGILEKLTCNECL
jgi:predicted RNA-binding Zn-ribbon protein involved in translation (DUF1610 family)